MSCMLSMKNLGIVYRNFALIQRNVEKGTSWTKITDWLNKRLKINIDEASVVECYEFVKTSEERSRRVREEYGGYDCL